MNDDLDLLASAYLDGDLDDPARVRAEGDPAVAARIVELRAVRDAVARFDDAAPPSPVTRDRVLHAALAAFDGLHEVHDPHDEPARVAGASVRSPSRPPRPARATRSRWLGAVAAATVIAAGVGAVVASVTRDGDDESAGLDEAAVVVTDAGADDRVESATAETAGGGAAADAAAPAAEEMTATTTVAAGTTAAADGSILQATEAMPESARVIVGDAELAAFAEEVARDVDAPVLDCADDRFAEPLASVEFAPDAASAPVVAVVVLDEAGTTAFAVDAARCDVLAAVAVDRQD